VIHIYSPKFSLTLEVLEFGGKPKFFIGKGCWNLGNWRSHDWSSLSNILLDIIFEIPVSSRVKIYLTSNVEVAMKCNINLLVLVLLVAYFYCTKFFQTLYSIHKNWNGIMEASIMRLFLKIKLTFLCLCWKSAILKIWI
jgi:hypothetical protein